MKSRFWKSVLALSIVYLTAISTFASSTYIEGFEPDPRRPEMRVRKIYLLIEDGKIKRKSLLPFMTSAGTKKILQSQTGPLLLSPGFIDLHGHLKYNVVPLWTEAKGQFINRFQWRGKSSYKKNVTGYLNNEALGTSGDKSSLLCQTYHYAEIKALIGGVTSIQGVGGDKGCTTGLLARNVEIKSDYEEATELRATTDIVSPDIVPFFQDVVFSKMIAENKNITETMGSLTEAEKASEKFYLGGYESFVNYFNNIFPVGNIRSFIAHLSEGRSQDSYNKLEYKFARTLGLAKKGLIIIHGVGLELQDLKDAAKNEISMVWSPLSNLLLYGETLNIKQAIDNGVNLTLGSDWSPSGSKNLLDEVKIAKRYLKSKSITTISDRKLYEMMTINPAKALKLDHKIGKLEVNYFADIVAIKLQSQTRKTNPYTQIIMAEPSDVQFVMVGGKLQIAKKAIVGRDDTFAESIISEVEQAKTDSQCQKYNDTFAMNTPLKTSELLANLKTVIPVLDELTGCNDATYQKITKDLFKTEWTEMPPASVPAKKSYDQFAEQLNQLNQDMN